mmetsp:Transcript_2368/g.5551  ORF Transcript_2368/g.5551 Transcript_2368/m.5551 type:complete len:241 (+) Transcript_2368:1955-2677(+)
MWRSNGLQTRRCSQLLPWRLCACGVPDHRTWARPTHSWRRSKRGAGAEAGAGACLPLLGWRGTRSGIQRAPKRRRGSRSRRTSSWRRTSSSARSSTTSTTSRRGGRRGAPRPSTFRPAAVHRSRSSVGPSAVTPSRAPGILPPNFPRSPRRLEQADCCSLLLLLSALRLSLPAFLASPISHGGYPTVLSHRGSLATRETGFFPPAAFICPLCKEEDFPAALWPPSSFESSVDVMFDMKRN